MFDSLPCIVDLYGHSRIAGRVTEQAVAGGAFLRVDVPEVEGQQGFTKFYGANAVYAITPVSEEVMLAAVRGLRVVPISPYELNIPVRKSLADRTDDINDDDSDDEQEIDF
jgi:hypothetical protein